MGNEIYIGQHFGRWTVIGNGQIVNGRTKIPCECSCEKHTKKLVEKYNLLNNKSKSCGCLTTEAAKQNFSTHRKTQTRLYHVWSSMKARCYNPNNKYYKNYGGRGITICPEWLDDFECFEKWALESGYDDKAEKGQYTIERIDVNKGYSPDNCCWKTLKEQANNRTTTIWLTYNGKTQTLLDWANEINVNVNTLRDRYDRGLPLEKILTSQKMARANEVFISYEGETHSLSEWAKIRGINVNTIWTRHRRKLPVEKILAPGRIN